ncbi:MAG TPA: MerR family transcriptional regulator [Chitinophagaceae bacterium]|nr:MerR family transcriptional regulator [Chitinophagaceae bacterium]
MKSFSQITFDFTDAPAPEEQGVKIRVKSIKQPIEQPSAPAAAPSKKAKRGRRPLKELEQEAENIRIPEDEVLFQKQYYSIGEVAEMFRVNTSLIRTWENEFDIIEPRKNRKGDRHFRPIDIKNLVLIHHLIRQRKYTLEGAKDYIKKNKSAAERFVMIQSLQKIKGFLLEIKANL